MTSKHDSNYWLEMGNIHFKSKRYQNTIECYEEAARLNSESSVVWSNIGVAHKNLGNYDREVECCEKAIKIDPQDSWTWYNLGVGYYHLEKISDALQRFETAL